MSIKTLLTSLLPFSLLVAQDWAGTTGPPFNWSVAANWSPATVPNSVGAFPTFPDPPVNKTVTLDINATVGLLGFNSTATYQIVGTQTLNFHNTTNPAFIGLALTNTAPIVIATPLTLVSDLQINNLGAATLTLSGVVGGSGGLDIMLVGAGPVVLTAQNSFTGGTTLNGGTLRLGVNDALLSGSTVSINTGTLDLNNFSQKVGTFSAAGGTVTLGTGTLTVAPTSNVTFSAVISGAGSLVFEGPATWTLGAAQLYGGTTTITGGTLQMGVVNGLPSTTAVTIMAPGILALNNNALAIASLAGTGTVLLGNATLRLNTVGTTTFSGTIQDTGNLIVQGTGTQVLTGANSYSGGTAVNAGATLEGTTTSLPPTIANNGTLFFNQAFSATYGGPLSGAGLLKIGGGGTISVTGTPSQGIVEVVSGALNINSGATLIATTVTVDAGGRLSGSGTVSASIVSSGAIAPRFPQLTVSGNVTFQAGSSLVSLISAGAAAPLTVLGSTTINPGSEADIQVLPGFYPVQSRYTLLTSAGGAVVGQFQTIELFNPFLIAQLIYNAIAPGSVELALAIQSISNVIQGGNAGEIAKCLTTQNMAQDPNLEQLISALIFLPIDQVRHVLDEMQPSQLRALTVAEQENALFAMRLLNLRMSQWYRSTCEAGLSFSHRGNFWISLAGNWTDQRAAEHNVGYRAPAAGLAVGFDTKVAERVFFGGMLEYGHAAVTWRESQGSSNIDRVSLGPYLGWTGQKGYVNGAVLGAFARFDTARRIPFFGREADSTHSGGSILTHVDGGFLLHPTSRITLSPFAAFDLIFGWEGSFGEGGAQSLDFSIASSSSSMLRSELGLKISNCAMRSHGKWVHELKASWVRESRFHGEELHAKFRQFPCSFTVEGLYPSRSFLDLAMGLSFIFHHDVCAASLKYEGQFGEGASVQSGMAELVVRF